MEFIWRCFDIDESCHRSHSRALTSILTKYQYTYQVCISILILILLTSKTYLNTDTSNFSVSVFLENKNEIITWYLIISKIKCNFTPLLMAVIIGNFQICNSILLVCFNWPFMIMAKVIRARSDIGLYFW